jgi:hypothetical protein
MKAISLLLFMFLFQQSIAADPVRMGTIQDAGSGESLSGVAVFVDGKLAAYSDEHGHYELLNVSSSSVIEFRLVSFEPLTCDVQTWRENQGVVVLRES